MPEEAAYRIKVGPAGGPYTTFETRTEHIIQDYEVRHDDNYPSVAWIELDVEEYIAASIDAGDEITVELVPWGGSALEQFFYGMVVDVHYTGPNRIRVLAMDALIQIANIDIDTVFADFFYDNYEADVQEPASNNDPAYVETVASHVYEGVTIPYDEVIKPLTRVQALERVGSASEPKYRPEEYDTTPNITTISNVNGKKYVGTRFVAPYHKYMYFGWRGNSDVATDLIILREDEDGLPDFDQQVLRFYNIYATVPPNYNNVAYFAFDFGARLNIGQNYWLIVTPNDLGSPYNIDFYHEKAKFYDGNTGQGIVSNSTHLDTGWTWEHKSQIGQMTYVALEWKDLKEGQDYNVYRNDGGTPANSLLIKFDGTEHYEPQWVSTAILRRNGARIFAVKQDVDIDDICFNVFLTIGQVLYSCPTGVLTIPFVDAIDGRAMDLMLNLMEAYGWHMRSLHRTEVHGSPGIVRIEPLPTFGSPVLDLKHGLDADDMTNEARVVSQSLKQLASSAYTGMRLRAKDSNGRLLYQEVHDPDLEEQLGLFSPPSIDEWGLRKCRLLKIRSAQNIEELKDFGDRLLERDATLIWKGKLTVDGATWLVPGQTITYENSRVGFSETELRVTSVTYTPNLMEIGVNSLRSDLSERFRELDRDLGRYASLQGLQLSDLTHQFYAHGRKEDDDFSQSTKEFICRLYNTDLAAYVSSWAHATKIAGPTVNGYPSWYVYCYFPPEGGDDGHGICSAVDLKETGSGASPTITTIQLDQVVAHWADNGCAVSLFLFHS